jgi:hypothetical protein
MHIRVGLIFCPTYLWILALSAGHSLELFIQALYLLLRLLFGGLQPPPGRGCASAPTPVGLCPSWRSKSCPPPSDKPVFSNFPTPSDKNFDLFPSLGTEGAKNLRVFLQNCKKIMIFSYKTANFAHFSFKTPLPSPLVGQPSPPPPLVVVVLYRAPLPPPRHQGPW